MKDKSVFFESLFAHASVAIIVVNAKGEIIMVNPFAVNLFGYNNAGELEGKHLDILIPYRFREGHKQHHVSYMKDPRTRPMGIGVNLYALTKDNAEIPVEISLAHLVVEGDTYVLAFVNDISLRKRIEEELVSLNKGLEEKVKERTVSLEETVMQLNRQIKETQQKDKELRAALEKEKELNELKSRFVSVASHEFRTPLSTMLSSVYLLQKYTSSEDQPKREKHIQRIISSINLLTEILGDFLSVEKIEEGKTEAHFFVFDLNANIEESVKEMQTICKKEQQILYTHTGERFVHLDARMLKHITLNLLANAIKFSPENSNIEVYSKVEGDMIELSFKDYGIGIGAEDKPHIFERFFRAANAINIQGTGLGLHIVARYTELMGGSISFNSEPGKGTEFLIHFKHHSPAI